jgi:predicted ATP-dependent serine protease
MDIHSSTQSELYLIRGRTGTGKTNKLLSVAIQHLLQDPEHNVLFLVTEATPLSIGQRLVRDYPSMNLPRIKVSDYHIGLTHVIPHPYTMLIIDDNGFKREVDE